MILPVSRTYEVEHEGKTYLVTQRTMTQRISRIIRVDRTVKGLRHYSLVDPDRGAERNLRTMNTLLIRAVIGRINAGDGIMKEEAY